MSLKPQRIEIILETLIESITLAEEMAVHLAASAGFNDDDQYKIGLSVHEAVMNAFQYGNQEQRDKKIQIVFELMQDKLVIHVVDQGTGFSHHDVPDPRMDENVLGETGRGLLLMKAFMDEFDAHITRSGGAEVIMAKHYRNADSPHAS